MQCTSPQAARSAPDAVERRRRPEGRALRGESTGKRTNEERNDPAVEPDAAERQLRTPHSRQQDAP